MLRRANRSLEPTSLGKASVTRANSKLLVAQYHVELPHGEECRERAFVLDGEKITPIINTRRRCTQY
jgi:hypothetical protein